MRPASHMPLAVSYTHLDVYKRQLRNKRLYRFTLGVTYDTSRPQLEQLMADLPAMLKASPYTDEDSVLVKLSGFGASKMCIRDSPETCRTPRSAFPAVRQCSPWYLPFPAQRPGTVSYTHLTEMVHSAFRSASVPSVESLPISTAFLPFR